MPGKHGRFGGGGAWTLLGILALLLVWQVSALAAGSELILPGPLPVLKRFTVLVRSGEFLHSLGGSLLRVILGIFLSVPLGVLAGTAAGLNRRAGAFLRPFFSLIAATPVMAVILIIFLILGQDRTPVFAAFLMVFPVMAANTIAGIRAVDAGLVELFRLYRLPAGETLRSLYLPSIMPFVLGGLRSSFALCWKVVVAAEVLVQPFRALGTGMQRARAQLETPELFAWTAAAVIAAALFELVLAAAEARLRRRR